MTLIALPLYDGHSVDGIIIIIIIIVLPLGRFLPPPRGVLVQSPWALSVVSIPDPPVSTVGSPDRFAKITLRVLGKGSWEVAIQLNSDFGLNVCGLFGCRNVSVESVPLKESTWNWFR